MDKTNDIEEAIKSLEGQPVMYDCSDYTVKPIISPMDALDKLDHTLCLNILEGNLKFSLDDYHDGPFDTPIDCVNVYEMLDCIDIIRKALIESSKSNPASPYWPYDPITHPYVTFGTTKAITYCDGCPNQGGLKDGLGNPIAGDSPCQWCTHNPMKVS